MLFNMPVGSLGTGFYEIVQDSWPLTHSMVVEIGGSQLPPLVKQKGSTGLGGEISAYVQVEELPRGPNLDSVQGAINLLKPLLDLKIIWSIGFFFHFQSPGWAVCQDINTVTYLHALLSSLNAIFDNSFFSYSFQACLCNRAWLNATSKCRIVEPDWYRAVQG